MMTLRRRSASSSSPSSPSSSSSSSASLSMVNPKNPHKKLTRLPQMADTIPLDLYDLASHYAVPNVFDWSPEEDEMLRNAVYVHGGRFGNSM